MTRQGLGPGKVLSVFLVVGGLSAIGWLLWQRAGQLIPQPPLLTAVLCLLLVAFVLFLAWPVRSHVKRTATRVLDPVRATRALVFAQAAALTGSGLSGWYAAQLALVLSGRDLRIYRESAWAFVVVTLTAILLAGAGLLAQAWCRVDPPTDDREDDAR